MGVGGSEAMAGDPDEVDPMFRAKSIIDGDAPNSDASRLCSPSRMGCLPLSFFIWNLQLRRQYSCISLRFTLLRSGLLSGWVGVRPHFSYLSAQYLQARRGLGLQSSYFRMHCSHCYPVWVTARRLKR